MRGMRSGERGFLQFLTSHRQSPKKMGTAVYIILNQEIQGIDYISMTDGKLLGQASYVLDLHAGHLGVKPLMSFFSETPDDLSEFLPESDDTAEETWFCASEGLKTLRAFEDFLIQNPDLLERNNDVIADIRQFSEILKQAEVRGIKWHLCVDY